MALHSYRTVLADKIEAADMIADVGSYVLIHKDEIVKALRQCGPGMPQEITDPAELLLSGLVGLVQLICHRNDLPAGLREAIAINHRYVDAVAFIERHDATGSETTKEAT